MVLRAIRELLPPVRSGFVGAHRHGVGRGQPDLRVPDAVGNGAGRRVESRIPGADVNPYLALAAAIAGGLWGIEHQLVLPEAFTGNAYHSPDVHRIPTTLAEAIEKLADSEVAEEAFGPEVHFHLLNTARQEWAAANRVVTDWELARNFERISSSAAKELDRARVGPLPRDRPGDCASFTSVRLKEWGAGTIESVRRYGRFAIDGKANLGYCLTCDRRTAFIETGPWLANDYLCARCHSMPRWRAMIRVLNTRFPKWRNLQIHECGSSGLATEKIRREATGYSGSRYLNSADVPRGQLVGNVSCQDIEDLTFPDESFDLVLTQDVLEHVLRPDRAFTEIARVLRPGGAHVFTVPMLEARPHLYGPCLRRTALSICSLPNITATLGTPSDHSSSTSGATRILSHSCPTTVASQPRWSSCSTASWGSTAAQAIRSRSLSPASKATSDRDHSTLAPGHLSRTDRTGRREASTTQPGHLPGVQSTDARFWAQ